ncbi:hypothetical protein GcM3_186052 [Golovinomyces cichoracearum]|uniref:Uncharacterized protein n=1 Tax=Golovinomyces cichoracearum TaxID=62708 RepID=A0A420HK23_9PEZI|nr:hypothetical protein GcM3_186052 [Golovinomyces cichoracearum]
MFDFNTRRKRPGSAQLFEDSDDREDSPSEVKQKTTKLEDLTIADSRNDTASLRLNPILNTPTTFERAHKITRGLGFETTSEIATEKSIRIAQLPVTRMPALNLPPFDGDGQNADRWLAMLKLGFGAANIDNETHPQLWLEAIYTKGFVSGLYEEVVKFKAIENGAMGKQQATIVCSPDFPYCSITVT